MAENRVHWVTTNGIKALLGKIQTRTSAGNTSVVIRQAVIEQAKQVLGAELTYAILHQHDETDQAD